MSAFMFDSTGITACGSTGQSQSTLNNSSQESFENIALKEHKITPSELEKLKSTLGVYQQGKNYNQIVNGHGTGLQPPTVEEWNTISESAYVVDNVTYSNTPSAVDNSNSPYFPPIGNQANQGSCVAWSVGYYIKTFQEAKEHSWNLTGATWDGDYSGHPNPSYQDKIISPAFIYNLINNGQDEGSSYYNAIRLACFIGISSWVKMPYNRLDYTSWPSEAAWAQAPYYRGDNSGYQYIWLNDNTGINNLKNLLASENLAAITVDGYKIQDPSTGKTLLTDKDMLTLDNYVNPTTNHAATIVGYDDNISYTEQNQIRYGAFKIANSWGKGNWEHISDGFYWISYETMKQRVPICYYYFDQINYQPDLLATFNINNSVRSNCIITVGLGNPNQPITTKCFNNYIFGGTQPFCTNNIVMDISEFKDHMPSLYNQSFFLDVYDNQAYQTNGTIMYFAIGNWSALGTPHPTENNQDVFLNVIYKPYVTSRITLLPAVGSTPLNATNYFEASYTLGGKQQVSYAQNGTLTFTADSGTKAILSGTSIGSLITSEEWVLNSQGTNVTIPAGSNTTFYYYNILSQQLAFTIVGGGNPTNPLLTYYTAPSAESAQFNQTINTIPIGLVQQTIKVMRGTPTTVSNHIPGISQEQWNTPVSFWNISQINQIPSLITYFHQYQVTASYSTLDKSVLSTNLILSGTQYGSDYQLRLTTINQTVWLDANTPWSVPPITTAISGTERWASSSGTSGNIIGAIAIEPSYDHQYYLTVSSSKGSPTGQGWYINGATAYATLSSGNVQGEPGIQYVFVSWSTGGTNYTKSNAIIMNSPVTTTASWQTQYQIVPSADSNSVINSSSDVWVNAGSSQTFTYSAKSGYTVNFVLVDGSSVPITGKYTFNNVQAKHTISVTSAVNPTITVSDSDGGSITPSGYVNVNYGDNQTFTITANTGYYTVDVTVNGASVGAVSSYTLNNIQGNYIISATFALTPTSGSAPTSTPTPTPIPLPTSTPSPVSSPTPTPSPTPSPTPTIQPSPSITPTPTEHSQNSPPPTTIENSLPGIPLTFFLYSAIVIAIIIIAVSTLVIKRKSRNKP